VNRRSQFGVRHEWEKSALRGAVRVATIGFAGKGTENFLDLLKVEEVRTAPDIRLN
jgi:hypothetical protein